MKSIVGYLQSRQLRKRLEGKPVVVVQHVEDAEISFAVHTWLEYHNRARDSYTGEPDTVSWLRNNLRPDDVLWDVGSNVGAYTILAAKLVPRALVVAFEPYIPTYAHLWDNIVLNNLTTQITPVCMALSDQTSLEILGISDPRAGSSEHLVGGKHFENIQRVCAIRGDDACSLLGVPPATLIKMDVDGYELPALNGMTSLLHRPSLRSLILEVERGKTEQTVSVLLKDAGFDRVSDSSAQTGIPVFNVVYQRSNESNE